MRSGAGISTAATVGCSGAARAFTAAKSGRSPRVEQGLERVLDVGLHRARGQVQDAHVLDVGALAAGVDERVVGATEHERREQLLAVTGSARTRRASARATR